jgi:hypothetical protein
LIPPLLLGLCAEENPIVINKNAVQGPSSTMQVVEIRTIIHPPRSIRFNSVAQPQCNTIELANVLNIRRKKEHQGFTIAAIQ